MNNFDKEKIEFCRKYILNNISIFEYTLNQVFDNSKETLKLELIKLIKNALINYKPAHRFIWDFKASRYTTNWVTGLKKIKNINRNKITLIQFLETEYIGNLIYKGEYKDDKPYDTWNNHLNTLSIGYSIYKNTISELLPIELTDTEFRYLDEYIIGEKLFYNTPSQYCYSPLTLLTYINDENFSNKLLLDVLKNY